MSISFTVSEIARYWSKSYTKPEVHNVLHVRQKRTEPWPCVTFKPTYNLVKLVIVQNTAV